MKRLDTWKEKHFKSKRDIRSKNVVEESDTSLLETDSEERENIPEDRFMIMGFDRGQVVIYNIFKFDIPISRHEVSRNRISMIREVRITKMHLIYDDTNMVTLCRLGSKGTEHIHQVNLFRPLFEIFVNESYVYAAYKSGDIEFLQVRDMEDVTATPLLKRRPSKIAERLSPLHLKQIMKFQISGKSHALVRYNLGKTSDHEDRITAITISPSNGWIASADASGLIKVWNN